MIWKYLFSSPSSSQCQEISAIFGYAYGQLLLSNSEIFLAGIDSNLNGNLRFLKITFRNTYVDWGMKMTNLSPFCNTWLFDAVIISNKLFSFFTIGNTLYVYFVTFSVSDGSAIGSRYISNINWNTVYDSAVYGDYVIAITYWSGVSILIMVNTSTNLFIF